MVLDFERYSSRRDRKKKRVLARAGVVIVFIAVLFFLGNLFGRWNVFSFSAEAGVEAPEQLSIQSLWSRISWKHLLEDDGGFPQANASRVDAVVKEAGVVLKEWSVLLLNAVIQKSDAVLDHDPLETHSLIYRGSAFFYLAITSTSPEETSGFLNQAITSFRRALLAAGQEPSPELFYMIGKCYFHQAKTDMEAQAWRYRIAVQYLEKSLALGYKGSDTFEYLAIANDENGNTDASIEYLLKASAAESRDRYLFRLAKNYAAKGDIVRAKEYLEQTLKISHNARLLIDARFLFGEILFQEQEYRKAEALYKDIIKINDQSAEAHFRLALIYEKIGDYAQYRYELRRTIENDPSHSGARNRL